MRERKKDQEKNSSGRADRHDAVDREARSSFARKSAMEQALQVGMHGVPQLRKKERSQHLGQLRERILKALTYEQIEERGTYPEIAEALEDPRARRLVISSQADLQAASEYIHLARESGVLFTKVDSHKYSGEWGLVVVSEEAVDVEDISVPLRRERLRAKGLPEELIDAVGGKICARCFRLLEERAPEEQINYRKQSFFDRPLGAKCWCNG